MGLEERRKREKENRKNAILKAARKLFFDKGSKNVTVESIAKKAELSKGSVYLYFKSKEDIYTQILLSDIDKFHKAMVNLIQEGQSSSAMLMGLANIYTDFSLNDRELFRIMMNYMLNTDNMNLPEEIDHLIVKATNKTIGIIEEIFMMGIRSGEFPQYIDLRQKRNAIWGLLNGIISLHLFTGTEEKREERIRSTIKTGLNTFLRGMRTPSGNGQ
ncbi:MAG: TetR/AcrR family transcriptional regulator [Syntrophales bacterium]|nr:TetR/AcrR family transcriptional regulator [Syntrophales bacterium]MCK9391665.1 TetR/AcrR family transcriptional regulator [Syntrophales bacterium]